MRMKLSQYHLVIIGFLLVGHLSTSMGGPGKVRACNQRCKVLCKADAGSEEYEAVFNEMCPSNVISPPATTVGRGSEERRACNRRCKVLCKADAGSEEYEAVLKEICAALPKTTPPPTTTTTTPPPTTTTTTPPPTTTTTTPPPTTTTTTPPPTTTESPCQIEQTYKAQLDNHDYLFSLKWLNWELARQRCHECGYHLAKIESQREFDVIKEWLTEVGIYEPVPARERRLRWGHIWVDGTDEGHQRCWVWTYPMVARMSFQDGFTFWGPNQPNYSPPTSHQANLLWKFGLKGNDSVGGIRQPFLCERDPAQPMTELPAITEVENGEVCR